MQGNHFIREARRRAGLTQRQLAARAGTTQSAIARLEGGSTKPSLEHLTELARACGLDLQVRLVPFDDQERVTIERNRQLTVDERARAMTNAARFVLAGREAMANQTPLLHHG